MLFKTILLETVLIILTAIFLVLPFERGKDIHQLKEIGLKVIGLINVYKNENGNHPDSLGELNTTYLTDEENQIVTKFFRYRLIRRSEEFGESLKEDYYSLIIEQDYFDIYYLRYLPNENRFILTDD